MEKSFTDNEIIKALECCKNADCQNCPRWSEEWCSGMCNDFLSDVLDLINRQKAEIERSQDLCGDCSMLKGKIETISELKEQIEYWQRGYNDLRQELKTTKSEARKEFAERLDELFAEHKNDAPIIWARITMKHLLQEMESESNAE